MIPRSLILLNFTATLTPVERTGMSERITPHCLVSGQRIILRLFCEMHMTLLFCALCKFDLQGYYSRVMALSLFSTSIVKRQAALAP